MVLGRSTDSNSIYCRPLHIPPVVRFPSEVVWLPLVAASSRGWPTLVATPNVYNIMIDFFGYK